MSKSGCLELAREWGISERLEQLAYEFVRDQALMDRREFRLDDMIAEQWGLLLRYLLRAEEPITHFDVPLRRWVHRWRVILTTAQQQRVVNFLGAHYPKKKTDSDIDIRGIYRIWDICLNHTYMPKSLLLEAEEYARGKYGKVRILQPSI